MPSLNSSDREVASTQNMIDDLLGLQLSEAEARTLLLGKALSFQELAENRSLFEMGTALIQAHDVLNRTREEASPEPKCDGPGCRWVNFQNKRRCVCIFGKPTLELMIEH